MTAMNMTIQQQPGGSGGSHYSSNSPASYPGSVSPIINPISQAGLNNNDFGAFSAYYAGNNAASNSQQQQQQHYYGNVIQQQHSPDNEEQQQQTLMST